MPPFYVFPEGLSGSRESSALLKKFIPLSSQVAGAGLAALFNIVLVAVIGAEEFGKFVTAIATVYLTRLIINLNLWQSVVPALEKVEKEGEVSVVASFMFIETTISMVAGVVLLMLLLASRSVSVETIACSVLLVVAMGDAPLISYLRYQRKFFALLALTVLVWFSRMTGLLWVDLSWSADGVIQLMSVSQLVHWVCALVFALKGIRVSRLRLLDLELIMPLVKKFSGWAVVNAWLRALLAHGTTIGVSLLFDPLSAGVHGFGQQIVKVYGVVCNGMLQLNYAESGSKKGFSVAITSRAHELIAMTILSCVFVPVLWMTIGLLDPALKNFRLQLSLYAIAGFFSLFTFPIVPLLLSKAKPKAILWLNLITFFGFLATLLMGIGYLELASVPIALICYQLIFFWVGLWFYQRGR